MGTDTVYEQLRAAIASGELQPHTRLIEADLMERFNATRPSVRVALVRLEQERLIEQEKNRSARVRLVEPKEAIEIYQARSLLESYAAGIAATKVTDEQLDELDALITKAENSDITEAVGPETEFHQKIVALSGNQTIECLCGSLGGHLMRYHHYTKLMQEWSANSPAEHRRIVSALRDHDSTAASDAMKAHLDRLTDVLRKLFRTS